MYVIGIDSGTQSTKSIVLDLKQEAEKEAGGN